MNHPTRRSWKNAARIQLLILATGAVPFQFGGCDPQLRATVENGIIESVTAAFGSLLTALVELATEQFAASLTQN
jgi:hypothetical protein